MKKLFYHLSLVLCTTLVLSCGDDDDDFLEAPPAFQDQVAQGFINGKEFLAMAGRSGVSPFEETEISVELTGLEITDICDEFFIEGLRLFFSVPNEVGLYRLGRNEYSITLFDPEETLNIIALDGAIEIETIDARDGGSVTGRILGVVDEGNVVNGNFNADYCVQ